jgi:hypothetical protein
MAILTVFSIIMATAAILLLLGMLKSRAKFVDEAKLILGCGVAKVG